MSKKTFGILVLSASALVAVVIAAQPGAAKSTPAAAPKSAAAPAPAAPAPKQQKLIRVSTLNGVQANQEFQSNVQLVQAQRQQAIELNAQMEKETNAARKKELKADVDKLMALLNDNNQKMFKTYGFTLDRNYTIVIETAHVYMFVTDEEADKFEKEQAAKAAKEAAPKKK